MGRWGLAGKWLGALGVVRTMVGHPGLDGATGDDGGCVGEEFRLRTLFSKTPPLCRAVSAAVFLVGTSSILGSASDPFLHTAAHCQESCWTSQDAGYKTPESSGKRLCLAKLPDPYYCYDYYD